VLAWVRGGRKEEWRGAEGSFRGVEGTVSASLSTEEFHLSHVTGLVIDWSFGSSLSDSSELKLLFCRGGGTEEGATWEF